MRKIGTTLFLCLMAFWAIAQQYTGYYVSAPKVHSFDHFKIKQERDETKIEGDLEVHAFCSKKMELWNNKATLVSEKSRRDYLIKEYGEGRYIVSVHFLKFPWDGNEWEYFLLGYMGEDKHRHFVIVEEIFYDETEEKLLQFNKFDWTKAHHISHASIN